MPKITDITGMKFNRWTVLSISDTRISGRVSWHCVCSCGNTSIIPGNNLTRGLSKSCGCLQVDQRLSAIPSLKQQHKPELNTWSNMWQRCANPANPNYPSYGGRGISVCSEWSDFSIFLRDMGRRPKNTSLDRIDNEKGYYKENCRWATMLEQSLNKRNNLYFEVNGVTKTQSEWAAELNISSAHLARRLELGWSVEDACTIPSKTYRRYN